MRATSAGQLMRVSLTATFLLVVGTGAVAAAPTPKISDTRHNLSLNGPGDVVADSETEICVFCHTPHGANGSVNAPLWNRTLSGESYDTYESTSLNALGTLTLEGIRTGELAQPAGSSRLCLSCHDGTLAIGAVGNKPGSGTGTGDIAMGGTTGGNMRDGPYGKTSGYTRNLSADLRNDHPISLTFDSALATADGELRDPSVETHIGLRGSASKPSLPLEPTGPSSEAQVQCGTCHDAHLNAEKFLRLNRFQQNTSAGASFNATNDQICIGCHDKMGTSWGQSAHANPAVATPTYKAAAAGVRGFPTGLPVWQAGCLNCHDTHTVSGSRRLLREGVTSSSLGTDDGRYKLGQEPLDLASTSAIEETCYQCHNISAQSVIENGAAPDIWSEFQRTVTMPITTANQRATREVHDVQDADFLESAVSLGKNDGATNNADNRHAECTDCHNPHRVIRNSLFNGAGDDTKRTHSAGGPNGNLASGVLRGAWGVEPVYGAIGTTWPQAPTYIVKKGDPATATGRTEPYLTREYQLCFKCHSDHSNDPANMPQLGVHAGGTAYSTNSLQRYTNVAAEFAVQATDPPTSGGDQGEETNAGAACGGGDCDPSPSAPGGTNNHRSWHPVIWPTGRDWDERGSSWGSSFSNIRAPFDTAVGTQTMYCSDCHGDAGSWTVGTGPNSSVQGPHGSGNNFLLKGSWVAGSGTGRTTPSSPGVCGNCHNPTNSTSGFATGNASHSYEDKDGAGCTFCHIAVPHGWKNKAFLVNLACVGPENGETSGFDANGCKSVSSNYTAAPYYVSARLSISSWARSRGWSASNCNGTDWMDNNCGTW